MLSTRGIKKYDADRKEMSLNLLSKVVYLGLCEKKTITDEWKEKESRFYNVAFCFSRYLLKTGELKNRWRVMGIGYDEYPIYNEYNKIHSVLFGKPLRRVNGRNVNFATLGQTLEKAARENDILLYLHWKSYGSYSKIDRVSEYTGEAKIPRSDAMDFPQDFYTKYLPDKGSPFSLSEDWVN